MDSSAIATKAGTVTGVLLSILVNLPRESILQTIILAAIGGITSFVATRLLSKLTEWSKRK
ncbi:MAG: hypothetical protein EAS48_10965 [Chryseobacterium sp.]|nr:MAG: hypothetical protein EAS48_10965 [Chryseobacterium sp.]